MINQANIRQVWETGPNKYYQDLFPWEIWTQAGDNHCVCFFLRDCDESQTDDEEEILRDKQQVKALRWPTMKNTF